MKLKSRTLKTLGLLLAALAFVPAAQSASWPDRAIRVIIPWSPGGSTTIVGRLLAADLSERLKQQVIIDNRPGAGGIVGMQIAARLPADGYNFLMTSTGYGYLIFKSKTDINLTKSFMPVALAGFGDSALAINPKLPFKSVKDLIAYAKKHPGKLNYSSSGIGGFPHMNTELFKLMAGVDIVHVPFKGGGPAVADTMAGNTQMHLGSLASEMAYIRSGKLKVLAVGGSKRNPQLPNVPTISEAGVPGYETYIWFGLFAPLGTPPDIIKRFHDAINTALKSPELQKKLDVQGVRAATMSTAEFGKLMESEEAKWTKVIKEAGITEN